MQSSPNEGDVEIVIDDRGQHMADPIFIAVAVLTVGTAIIALEARELIYGAISLAISMLGIAGFSFY